MIFQDRHAAGKELAKRLHRFKELKSRQKLKNVLVLGIPRGGIEVAFEIAKMLKVPLSIIATKKLTYASNLEFAIGAVSPDSYILDEKYIDNISKDFIEKKIKEINFEVERKYKPYINKKNFEFKGKTLIIADDGLATGYTMLAAIKYAKSKSPKKIVVAVPVAAHDSLEKIRKLADKTVYIHVPVNFGAVSSFYHEFAQLEDKDVKFYLEEAKKFCNRN
ncbi:phosphoribosyltransferase [Candidatus Woesearchaeota archaeon]|nr:phosphoribosyltransferase [Candidatus Woesearchaeota archaeon]